MPPKKAKIVPAAVQIFDGVVVTLAGDFGRTQKDIGDELASYGGKLASTVTKAVTHVVATKEEVENDHKKVQQAREKSLHIVSYEWLTESIKAVAKQDEQKFSLAAIPPTPKAAPAPAPARGKRAKAGAATDAPADASAAAAPPSPRAKRAKKTDDAPAPPPATAAPPAASAPSPAAAPASPKAEEKKVTVVSKGRAAVDPNSGLADRGHVYEEGDTVYNAMLNQTNIGNNNNKFYVIQIIELDSGGSFFVYNRWGRVGERGQDKKIPVGSSLASAKSQFEKKYKEKTSQLWTNRANFKAVPGKYTLIEIDYGHEAAQAAPSSPRPLTPKSMSLSKLDPRVQELMKLIFDIKMMERVMVQLEFDINKMPLGKLTKQQVTNGYDILKQIEAVLTSQGARSQLEHLTNQFYTAIPHNFGRQRPPTIANTETLKMKMQMLEALADIAIATKIMQETADSTSTENPIDSNYEKLKCAIEAVDESSEEYQQVLNFVKNNQEVGRDQITLLELFKVSRAGESDRFAPKKSLGDRRLLWHGSRLTNFAGILAQGLRIAPPEAPASGYRFGKGLYFADIMTLSSMYCRVTADNPIGCMLLVDVALGKKYEAPRDQFMTKAPAGYDSTWALGTVQPDPSGNVTTKDGSIIPAGKISPSGKTGVACHEHQFITYDEAQSEIRYLLKLKWKR